MATYNGPAVGSEYTLDAPASGSTGGFFEAVSTGIDAFGKIAGIGLNTYAGVQTVKANNARPETTYDQEYIRDIAGAPVAVNSSNQTLLIVGGLALAGLVAFSLLQNR